jgi:hypothetical protein
MPALCSVSHPAPLFLVGFGRSSALLGPRGSDVKGVRGLRPVEKGIENQGTVAVSWLE